MGRTTTPAEEADRRQAIRDSEVAAAIVKAYDPLAGPTPIDSGI